MTDTYDLTVSQEENLLRLINEVNKCNLTLDDVEFSDPVEFIGKSALGMCTVTIKNPGDSGLNGSFRLNFQRPDVFGLLEYHGEPTDELYNLRVDARIHNTADKVLALFAEKYELPVDQFEVVPAELPSIPPHGTNTVDIIVRAKNRMYGFSGALELTMVWDDTANFFVDVEDITTNRYLMGYYDPTDSSLISMLKETENG